MQSGKDQNKAAQSDLSIIDFTPDYADDFKRLNVEWITQHWELEDADRRVLDHPQSYILDKGGAIFIALYEGQAIGTVALLAQDEGVFELAKMAVSPTVQGKGFGFAIAEHALRRARELDAHRVYLESNTILGPALSLYRKLGFKEMTADSSSPYSRCNIQMEISL